MEAFSYISHKAFVCILGLGGTCVNVGCIPKKLMHQAALLGKYQVYVIFTNQEDGRNNSNCHYIIMQTSTLFLYAFLLYIDMMNYSIQ